MTASSTRFPAASCHARHRCSKCNMCSTASCQHRLRAAAVTATSAGADLSAAHGPRSQSCRRHLCSSLQSSATARPKRARSSCAALQGAYSRGFSKQSMYIGEKTPDSPPCTRLVATRTSIVCTSISVLGMMRSVPSTLTMASST
jgi:hypothetical protein